MMLRKIQVRLREWGIVCKRNVAKALGIAAEAEFEAGGGIA